MVFACAPHNPSRGRTVMPWLGPQVRAQGGRAAGTRSVYGKGEEFPRLRTPNRHLLMSLAKAPGPSLGQSSESSPPPWLLLGNRAQRRGAPARHP